MSAALYPDADKDFLGDMITMICCNMIAMICYAGDIDEAGKIEHQLPEDTAHS